MIIPPVDYPLNRNSRPGTDQQTAVRNQRIQTTPDHSVGHPKPSRSSAELRVNCIARRLIRPNAHPQLDSVLSTRTGVVVSGVVGEYQVWEMHVQASDLIPVIPVGSDPTKYLQYHFVSFISKKCLCMCLKRNMNFSTDLVLGLNICAPSVWFLELRNCFEGRMNEEHVLKKTRMFRNLVSKRTEGWRIQQTVSRTLFRVFLNVDPLRIKETKGMISSMSNYMDTFNVVIDDGGNQPKEDDKYVRIDQYTLNIRLSGKCATNDVEDRTQKFPVNNTDMTNISKTAFIFLKVTLSRSNLKMATKTGSQSSELGNYLLAEFTSQTASLTVAALRRLKVSIAPRYHTEDTDDKLGPTITHQANRLKPINF
ncbi:hypothetical protein BLNAU_7246 [Blattamonas nauphoetae]|uniref:Uncharacterized protein n=1 Tax=Blattamonas nauphoetae TaxID=2049346 RepID=A0ABQ9Y247_9EUKA|nr:hypothetical protein BLNAU_7246 [Blattamonas nauphoetae]